METKIISDKLGKVIEDGNVKAAVFTTYNFEPEFFELDVIPILLKQDNAYSVDEQVKSHIIRDALMKSSMQLEVFYDAKIFRSEGSQSPQMGYLYHGVNLGNRAFHSKSIYILMHSDEYGQDYLIVGAGSNNLSKSGWWDNIEAQHWEVVWDGEIRGKFKNRLQEDVSWLEDRQGVIPNRHTSGLALIKAFLERCHYSHSAKVSAYYGLSHKDKHGDFISFLTNQKDSVDNFQNWKLEIISPFFAEDTKNDEHKAFFKLGVQSIRLLLPMDEENNALCHKDYYLHIKKTENITWARWHDDYVKTLGVGKQPHRRLHAKIYHFYKGRQSWVFVGSVNFTHKALRENVESGFLIKLDKKTELLTGLENEDFNQFKPPDDIEGESDQSDANTTYPELHLSFDWVKKKLSGRTGDENCYSISLEGPDRKFLVDDWRIESEESMYSGSTELLQSILKNGSFFTAMGNNLIDGQPITPTRVLIQQTGLTHKPVEILNLSPNQILAIFAGMSAERRQLVLANAYIRQLILSGYKTESSTLMEEGSDEQFFCKYAEIFHAFRKFEKQLIGNLEVGKESQVDYYLSGTGVDSLPSLLAKTKEKDGLLDATTTYLLLLSARDIYQNEKFKGRSDIDVQLKELNGRITEIKEGEQIILGESLADKRKDFFTWFEREFGKEYKVQVKEHEVIEEA